MNEESKRKPIEVVNEAFSTWKSKKRDFVEIGQVPSDERCEQAGVPTYNAYRARKECRAYINQLRREFGPEPEGANLAIRSCNGGEYVEVVCYFDDEVGLRYAFRCEREASPNWDSEAKIELFFLR